MTYLEKYLRRPLLLIILTLMPLIAQAADHELANVANYEILLDEASEKTGIPDVSGLGIESYSNKKIHNWAENVVFTPEIFFVPKNKAELIAIVKLAQQNNKRITIIGKGHSWNPLMEGSDYLISTVKLTQVWVHADEGMVTVEAGATIDLVDQVIHKHGLMVPCNIVGTTAITYGGIMATGSHGSGMCCPSMSDFVEEIEFIKSDGETVTISEASHGPDIMNAARLNLGLFGIMYTIKFRVQRGFNVEVTDQGIAMEKLFSLLPIYLAIHENVEVLWFPLTDRVIIKFWDRSKKPLDRGPLKPYIENKIAKWAIYEGFTPIIKCLMEHYPQCIAGMSKIAGKYLFPDRTRVEPATEAIHYVNEAVSYPINETEIAVTYDLDDLSRVKAGWQAMVDAVYENAAKGNYSLNVIIHMRFIRGSKATLSPSLNNENTCYMDYGSYYKTSGWQDLVNQIWTKWSQIPGVKLHWAKDMRAYADLDIKEMYGVDNVEQFLAIRKQFDPTGMFLNDFMKKLFKIEDDSDDEI